MKCYGTLELTVASPTQTFVEPLTLAEVKKFLELPERSPVDEEEDAMLDGFISGSREQAEIFQNRDLVQKQYDLSLDWFSCEIELRRPLASVDLVQYRDSAGEIHALDEDTDYIVDLARGLILPPYAKYWPSFAPWPSSAVLVRFTSGMSADDPFWSDAGARLKNGMKFLISAWFNHRLPFEIGPGVANEYPYTVTQLLSAGANARGR